MSQKLTRHCLLLCPLPNVPAANAAAGDVTGMAAPGETFSPGNIMLKDGTEYVCAGVYITDTEFTQVQQLAQALNGFYYTLKQDDGSGWYEVQSLVDCMTAQGLTRPEIEEEV